MVARLAGKSGLNHPLTGVLAKFRGREKKMAKTEGVEIVIKHKDLAPEPCENCGSKLVFHEKRKVGEWIRHELECGYCGSMLVFHEKQEKKEGENEK